MYSETTNGLHQIRAADKFWHQSSSVIKNVVKETILIEFGIPKKLARLIKMCLAETYSRVRVA
jgi:hypothetical protein